MELQIIVIVCFLGITAMCGAAYMLLRDLLWAPQSGGTGARISKLPANLRRARTVFDQQPARTFAGKIDQAFDRMVLETGIAMSPVAAFLLILSVGLLIGGALFVAYENPILGACGMMGGMLVTIIYLNWRRLRRLAGMREEFPNAVDLLARAVRAGESVDQALDLIAKETKGPLGDELRICANQISMGLSVAGAMESMARRVRLEEVRILATTLMVHRTAGGNLPQALERMAEMAQDRLDFQRTMRAKTGAGRSSTILIATISPLVYLAVFIWQPNHVKTLYTDPIGQMLLTLAVVLEVIGVLWVMALLRQEN